MTNPASSRLNFRMTLLWNGSDFGPLEDIYRVVLKTLCCFGFLLMLVVLLEVEPGPSLIRLSCSVQISLFHLPTISCPPVSEMLFVLFFPADVRAL